MFVLHENALRMIQYVIFMLHSNMCVSDTSHLSHRFRLLAKWEECDTGSDCYELSSE